MDRDSWIPVSASLPSLEDGWVLIVIDFHEPFTRRARRLGYYEPRDNTWRTQLARVKPHWEVTHWRPLPELPEQETSDG